MVVRPVRHALENFLAPRPRHLARRPIRLHGKTSPRAHVVIQPKQIQFKTIHRALRELRVVCDSRSSVVVLVVSLSIARPRRSESNAPRAPPKSRRFAAPTRFAPRVVTHPRPREPLARAPDPSSASISIAKTNHRRSRRRQSPLPRPRRAFRASAPRAARQSPSRVRILNIPHSVPVRAFERRRAPNHPETRVHRALRAIAALRRARSRPSSSSSSSPP